MKTFAGNAALLFVIASAETAPAAESPELLRRKAKAVGAAVGAVSGSVVQLQAIGGGDPLAGDGSSKPTTGLLLDREGLVVTSSYGLDPRPAAILVTYADGSRATGKLLAIDHNRQIALVAAGRGPEKPPAKLLRASEPLVGQTAIAVGRTFRRDQPNVAVGIVSAKARLYGRAVQTDAAVSPANYGGPLIDLSGRVIGVLTPLAPKASGPGGGVGLYDSGIGFAVPMAAIEERLDRMRAGEDLHRGLAGIAFIPGSDYTTPAKLRTVHPGGPADRAGLVAGDIIQSVGGLPIQTANDYQQATQSLDAGRTLSVVALRGEKKIAAELALVAELQPYRHPYLGVIAERTTEPAGGVTLSEVLPDGPAAKAGVRPADRLLAIGDAEVATREEALTQLAASTPGDAVTLKIGRGGQTLELDATVATLGFDEALANGKEVAVADEAFVVPGFTRKCKLTRPKETDGRLPVLVWLGGALGENGSAADSAKAGCLVVEPAAAAGQNSLEAENAFVAALVTLLVAREDVDENRLAIGGAGRSAALALALGLRDEGRFAGVVVGRVSGRAPRIQPSTPSSRVGVLTLGAGPRGEALAKALTERGYPVHKASAAPAQSAPAWLRGLDRF